MKKFNRIYQITKQYILSGLCIFIAGFLFVALLSYHPLDPSFNSAFDNEIYNKSGKFGAYIADPALEILGISSYLIPIALFAMGIRMFLVLKISNLSLRISALLFNIITLSFIASFITTPIWWQFESLGGYLGILLNSKVLPGTNNIIRILIGVMLFTYLSIYIMFIKYHSIYQIIYLINDKTIFFMKTKFPYLFDKTKIITYQSFILIRKFIFKTKTNTSFKNNKKDILNLSLEALEQEEKKLKKLKISHIISNQNRIQKLTDEDYPNYSKESRNNNQEFAASPNITHEKTSKPRKQKIDDQLLKDIIPPINLLQKHATTRNKANQESLEANAQKLNKTLEDFGVIGKINGIRLGPVVTLYEFEPAPGIKSSRIMGLSDDISRSMEAISTRIAIIPGRNALGIELPNKNKELISLREIIESPEYNDHKHKLPIALGKDISGKIIIVDLAKMPHLLVAGTTGSGKSVAINVMILSILYKLPPNKCRFIMIDPKMLELSIYNGIPHLLTEVVTEPKKAVSVLRWAVEEMERRYKFMSLLGVRNIDGYNTKIETFKEDVITKKIQTGHDPKTRKAVFHAVEIETKPFHNIVIIIDEMADLMLVAGKEIEVYVQRLAQMARAAGVHLITATQRPSVDVITGVIKANFPTRISFQVTSKIDSRTILGEQGAEELLGQGDMLYMSGGGRTMRVHGPFSSDHEVERVVNYLKETNYPSDNELSMITSDINVEISGMSEDSRSNNTDEDPLYNQALEIIMKDKKVSTSYIQRKLKIGYNRAANIIETMEENSIVSPPNHIGRRELLVNQEESN